MPRLILLVSTAPVLAVALFAVPSDEVRVTAGNVSLVRSTASRTLGLAARFETQVASVAILIRARDVDVTPNPDGPRVVAGSTPGDLAKELADDCLSVGQGDVDGGCGVPLCSFSIHLSTLGGGCLVDRYHGRKVGVERRCDLVELGEVEASVAAFVGRDERLGNVEGFGDVDLAEPGLLA